MEAARALGISVSTLKRWVDSGVLPAHKTVGGHRKLERSEVLALVRTKAVPQGDLGTLTAVSPRNRRAGVQSIADEMLAALLEGDQAMVSAIIGRAYRSGVAIEALADGVIAPVMQRIGHDWENARIEIWHEHRGTQLCAAALYDLKRDMESRAERNRPVALGGAPEGDPYLLPTLLAEMVLLDAGWLPVQLGPNIPLSSLVQALQKLRPKLVWLSISHITDMPGFRSEYHEFHRQAQRNGVAVAIGGRALSESLRAAIPYTAHGDKLGHLAAFAKILHPRPKPPRRGRPPQR
jgi:excisionase family DNA binding protein